MCYGAPRSDEISVTFDLDFDLESHFIKFDFRYLK